MKCLKYECVHFRQLEADAKCRTFNREDSEGSQRNEEAEAEELAVSWLDVMKRYGLLTRAFLFCFHSSAIFLTNIT